MKQYSKPMVDVVELTVRENIANLPKALVSGSVETTTIRQQPVTLTTYNLASSVDSNSVNG